MHAVASPRHPLAVALALALLVTASACSKTEGDASMAKEEAVASQAIAPAADMEGRARAEPMAGGALGAAADVKGLANRNGSQLAYEHDVRVRVAADKVAVNLGAVRDACNAQKFGACDVLGEELGAGDIPVGELQMRAAPEAVAGLVQTAAAGGEVTQRSTHAEDLADAVRDNGFRRKRLELQHAKLSEILQTQRGTVDELVALTERLAMLEAELAAAEQDAAQHQRRIATNKLSLHFESQSVTVATIASTKVGDAFRSLTGTWDEVFAWMIRVLLGALLPFALLIGFGAWVLVKLLRRGARRAESSRATAFAGSPAPPSRDAS